MKREFDAPFDTVIVAAQEWGFQYVLLDKNMWYLTRIDKDRIKKVKYIAYYQTAPICAINYYSKVKKIEFNWKESHFDVYLTNKPIKIPTIILDPDKRHLAIQGTKFILLSDLLKAKKLSDLVK